MDFHARTVERDRLDFNGDELLALKTLKNPVEGAALAPSVHTGVNGVPVAEFFRQPAPFAAVLQNI